METNYNNLNNAISKEEFDKVPKYITKKLEKYMVQRSQELICQKTICENAEKQLKAKNDKIEALKINLEDATVKINLFEKSVKELTEQLDISKNELRRSIDTTLSIQSELNKTRHQYNAVVEDRNNMTYNNRNLIANIGSFKLEITALHEQLNNTIRLKNEAILKYNEVQSRDESLIFKEQQYKRDFVILQAQSKSYHESMNKYLKEVQTLREKHASDTLELTANYKVKTEELCIANELNAGIMSANTELKESVCKLNDKLKEERDDTTKVIECYKRELQARENLVDLQTETKSDYQKQINEFSTAINELKTKLQDSSNNYAVLETNSKATEERLERLLEERDTEIINLKDDLKQSNELLLASKDELLAYDISQISPTGVLSSIMKKRRLTITEMYTKLVQSNMSIIQKDKEIRQLEIQLKGVLEELEEKAATINKIENEYQKALDENMQLKEQLNILMASQQANEQANNNMKENYHGLEYKIERLSSIISDLKSQNICLLKAQDMLRAGINVDYDYESERILQNSENNGDLMELDLLSESVLSNRLINYSSIEELQENNQKLILMVRDLSSKVEEMEEVRINATDNKIVFYETRIKDLEEAQQYQDKMMDVCISQKEHFKYLIDLIKKNNNQSEINALLVNDQNTEIPNIEGQQQQQQQQEPQPSTNYVNNKTNNTTINQINNNNDKQRCIELEVKIKVYKNQLKELKTEYDDYRKEKNKNDQILIDQCENMRNELRDLTASNCKLMSAAEFNNEQLKTQKNTAQILRKQIQSLEDRNKMYDGIIVKNEKCVEQLRNELLAVLKKLQDTELHNENLKLECKTLRDAESRIKIERDILHGDHKSISLLVNSFDTIKLNMERTQNDALVKSEKRYKDATRELTALRHRLQAEQEYHREQILHYERETETAKDRLKTELIQLDKHQIEIKNLRVELLMKTEQNNDLCKKLNESLQPRKGDNPVYKTNKKLRDINTKYNQSQTEIETLRKQLTQTTQSVDKYYNMAQNHEIDLSKLRDEFDEYRKKMEEDLNKTKKNEADYKLRAVELENDYKLLVTDSKVNETDDSSQLSFIQNELKIALQKINENNREIRDLRDQCSVLSNLSQTMEKKYHDEMVSHSNDIQLVTICKDELNKLKKNNEVIKSSHDAQVNELNVLKETTQANMEKVQSEKTTLDERINDLIEQNAQLHLALDEVTVKITNKGIFDKNDTSAAANKALDSSISSNIDENYCSLNAGNHEMNVLLFSIIKYIRKEKNIAFSQVDVLKAENIRLNYEIKLIQKKFDEFELQNKSNNSIDELKSDLAPVKKVQYDELLRKVEVLNAVTDSNRLLREQRTTLTEGIKELKARIVLLENELLPLQQQNRDLTSKHDEQQMNNSALRTEVERWRTRASTLVERSNKNPEEFKRIQNEREGLAKMLTAHKENIKLLNEEIAILKNDKQRIENDLNNVNKLYKFIQEEKCKSDGEHDNLKAVLSRHTKELLDTKNNLYQREDALKKTTEELSTTNNSLLELRNQLPQLRKIAKSYKDRYMALKSKMNGREVDLSAKAEEQLEIDDESMITIKNENEKLLSNKINDLNSKIVSLQEECNSVHHENLLLKTRIVSDHKEITNQLNESIEANKQAHNELQLVKNQLKNCEQNKAEQNSTIGNMKLKLETKIAILEKDLSDHTKEIKELEIRIEKLTRENEALICMHSASLQPGAKADSTNSGTIEKSSSDPACTANVKAMTGLNFQQHSQQSATVQPRRRGGTPLASLRPKSVQNSRTAAILLTSPTSSNSNVGTVQCSISSSTIANSGCVTALVLPQQQVYTTGSTPGEAIVSPTISHTDYMPAAVVVAAAPPMATSSSLTVSESSQETESTPNNNINSAAQNVGKQQPQIQQRPQQQQLKRRTQQSRQQQQLSQQQAVALVSPRIESATGSRSDMGSSQNMIVPQLQTVKTELNKTPSTSGPTSTLTSTTTTTSSTSTIVIAMSIHHQAPSSNTVTTTNAGGHKRPRDAEDDCSNGKTSPQTKRNRVTETCQGSFTESDGHFGDDADNGKSFEIKENYDKSSQDQRYVVDVASNIDEDDSVTKDGNNEIEVYDCSEVLNQSGSISSHVTSQIVEQTSSTTCNTTLATATTTATTTTTSYVDDSEQTINTQSSIQQNNKQIQTISSGSDEICLARSSSQLAAAQISSSCRQATTIGNRQQQQQQRQQQQKQQQQPILVIQQQQADGNIVPNTPALFVPGRAEGFSESVSLLHLDVPNQSRLTFAQPNSSRTATPSSSSSSLIIPIVRSIEGMDDTRIDLSQMHDIIGSTGANTVSIDIDHGGQNTQEQQKDIELGESRSTLHTQKDVGDETLIYQDKSFDVIEGNIKEEESTDGVSSEGEKPPGNDVELKVEEGRVDEVSQTQRVRGTRGRILTHRTARIARHDGRISPISWNDGEDLHEHNMSFLNEHNIPHVHQQQQQQQQAPRGMRNRRDDRRSFYNKL